MTLAGVEDARRHDVELAPDTKQVLRERRFHYDAVVGDASTLERRAELLEQFQPQANRVSIDDLANEALR